MPDECQRLLGDIRVRGGLLMAYLRCLLPVLVLLLPGCSTLQLVDEDTVELREEIRGGELIAAGDRVDITTRDCTVYRLVVSEVRDGYIHGYAVSQVSDELPQAVPSDNTPAVDIAIDDIVRIDTENAEDNTCIEHDFYVRLVLFMGVVAFIISHLTIF